MDELNLGYFDGETKNDRGRRLGMALGYPKCCIDAFQSEDYMNRPIRKLDGTGYVPCADCNNKSENEIIEFILKHRKTEIPFPKSPWDI